MNMLFVVRFGAGRACRYLARAETKGMDENGWRPFIWVKDIARAEKFGSRRSAETFAREALGHSQWDVGMAPPQGLPTGDLGGSPAAMRAAA